MMLDLISLKVLQFEHLFHQSANEAGLAGWVSHQVN
jgi:hypothetical protein